MEPYDVSLGAWLSTDLLAFVVGPEPDSAPYEARVGLYSLTDQTWQILELPPSTCARQLIRGPLERLPDGRLGFLSKCTADRYDEHFTLYAWDSTNQEAQPLYSYPKDLAADGYSFSPDMGEAIQHSAIGSGLNDQLYRVTANGDLERLWPDFQRVAAPSWSPSGEHLAFFGTASYPGNQPGQPLTSSGIAGLLAYPWDLYVVQPDVSALVVVLPGIVDARQISWSPNGRWLAFTGEYEQVRGLWLLQWGSVQPQPVLVRTGLLSFSWAPDGQRILVTVYDYESSTTPTVDVELLDLPEGLGE